MGALFGGSAVLLLPVLLISSVSWLLAVPGFLVAAQLGVVTTAVAYLRCGRGLRTVPAPVAVTLGLAEPVAAAAPGHGLAAGRSAATRNVTGSARVNAPRSVNATRP